jgi:hypothetical protein
VIAELFYPKELKNIIADLRAKGDLREVPLNILKKEIGFVLFVMFVVVILAFATDGVFAGSSLAIVFVFFISMHIKATINRFMAYTNGNKHQGVITKIVRNKVISR